MSSLAAPVADDPAWERRLSAWSIPSWLLSLGLHAGFLLLLTFGLRERAPLGNPDAIEREVGIYFQNSENGTGDFPADGFDRAATVVDSDLEPADAEESLSLDSTPPVPLELPTAGTPMIGPGVAAADDDSAETAQPAAKTGRPRAAEGQAGGSGGGRPGGTTFFGAKAEGGRFVYVLDASGSMLEHNAIRFAKSELLASLLQLEATQQFQIVFYNERNFPMVSAGGKAQLFWGTDVNRHLAKQFVSGVGPDGGTRHLPAILEALNYVPDVIFFLTDAGEPRLEAVDLDKIKRRNNGRTRIHVIEFGTGPPLKIDNFLQKLARQNGGSHVYRDVTQFGNR